YVVPRNCLCSGRARPPFIAERSPSFSAVAHAGLTLAVVMNVVGLNVGKWLNNAGATAGWVVGTFLIVFGAVSWMRFGSATPIAPGTLAPSTTLKDVIFWSTIAFAFGGVESGSTMGEEIVDARRTVPRAILAAGAVMTILYM